MVGKLKNIMEITYSLPEIEKITQQIIPLLTSQVVVFQGDMGMGKTTFIKSLVRSLGIDDVVTSPTFGLVNCYENNQTTIYHFDFYRITSDEEAFSIGFEEYLYSGKWCFIEWAEKVKRYLPDSYVILSFEFVNENARKIKITKIS